MSDGKAVLSFVIRACGIFKITSDGALCGV